MPATSFSLIGMIPAASIGTPALSGQALSTLAYGLLQSRHARYLLIFALQGLKVNSKRLSPYA